MKLKKESVYKMELSLTEYNNVLNALKSRVVTLSKGCHAYNVTLNLLEQMEELK